MLCKVEASNFLLVSFVRFLWGAYHPRIAMYCFVPFGKRTRFHRKKKKKILQKGENVWSWFHATETHWKHLVPQSISQGNSTITHFRREAVIIKSKGCFSFQTTIWAGVLSLSGINIASRKFPASCVVSLWDFYWLIMAPASLCSAFPCLQKEHIFLPNQTSLESRSCSVWV